MTDILQNKNKERGTKMSVEKYFALSGHPKCRSSIFEEGGPIVPITTMNQNFYKGCFYADAGWIMKPHKRDGLVKHESDELLMFVGSDTNNPENLNAEIEIQLENDILTLKETCFVFVPGGVAHGNIKVLSVDKPVFCYTCHLTSDSYTAVPGEATAAVGTYAGNAVYKYAPVDGKMPTAPEGFLTLLLWIDGKKLAGAPYTEAVWFNQRNETGPAEHDHDFDEIIAFFGSDPDNPDDLGGEIEFMIEGEKFTFTKSCLVYVPRGVDHSPIMVPKHSRPILHFSGGNGGDYKRSSGEF